MPEGLLVEDVARGGAFEALEDVLHVALVVLALFYGREELSFVTFDIVIIEAWGVRRDCSIGLIQLRI